VKGKLAKHIEKECDNDRNAGCERNLFVIGKLDEVK
jgi:hypothetical protein